jgi:protein tyrosine phosphatase (PTP) superfamily phosphohydrolase (DUF442 family)
MLLTIGGRGEGKGPMPEDTIDAIYHVLPLDEGLLTGGQPTAGQLAAVARAGYEVVINLATPDSPRALADEAALVTRLGMRYVALPVAWEAPAIDDFERFGALMACHTGKRLFVHCAANMRVSAFCYLYRVLHQGMAPAHAARDLAAIWEPNPTWRAFMEHVQREYTSAE